MERVYERIKEFETALGPQWKSSALLARVAQSGGKFAELQSAQREAVHA